MTPKMRCTAIDSDSFSFPAPGEPMPERRCEREIGHAGAHRYVSGDLVVEFGDRTAEYVPEKVEDVYP